MARSLSDKKMNHEILIADLGELETVSLASQERFPIGIQTKRFILIDLFC